jgi:hypothetical protein
MRPARTVSTASDWRPTFFSGLRCVWYIAVAMAIGVGRKGLHLIEPEVVALEPERQIEHIQIGRSRMRGDEVRDQVLLLARLLREFVEHRLERVVARNRRLHHVRQRPGFGVLRRNLQVAANVVLSPVP